MVTSFFYGPMAAGKTDRLLKSYKLSKRYKLGVSILQPLTSLNGHPENQHTLHTTSTKYNPDDVYTVGLRPLPERRAARMVLVDDAHFLAIEEVEHLVKRFDKTDTSFLMFFGLYLDYALDPFPASQYLMDTTHYQEFMPAVCAICGDEAKYTQRLMGNRAATIGEKVLLGGADVYEPRCSVCYTHPTTMEELRNPNFPIDRRRLI